MPGGTDDKQQGGNGNDPDEASKLKQAAADLTKLAQNAARGIVTMTENTKPITITNICQADNPKKADAKSTKDSAGSSRSKRNDVSMLSSQNLWIFVLRKCRSRLRRKTVLRRIKSRKLGN